jgi:hypothetical protein
MFRAIAMFILFCACTDGSDIVSTGGKKGGRTDPVVDPKVDPIVDPVIPDCAPNALTCSPGVVLDTNFVNANHCYRISSWNASDYQSASGGNSANRYPSFAIGDFYYVNTKGNKTVALKTNADGTPLTWTDTGFEHGGVHGFTAVSTGSEAFMFRNGHVGRYSLNANTGTKVNNDKGENEYTFYEGDVDQVFDRYRWVWDSAVYAKFANGNSFFIHLGGWGHTVPNSGLYHHARDIFRVKLPMTPHGTKFDRVDGVDNPEDKPGKSAFLLAPSGTSGFLFASGQSHDRLHRITVNDSGDFVGSWSQINAQGVESSGQGRGDLVPVGRSLLWVRGNKVNLFDLSTTGELSAKIATPDLPVEQRVVDDWGGETDGASWGIIKDKLYLTTNQSVYWTSLQKTTCTQN